MSKYDRYMATPRFSGLDGLRAVSVLAVIWQHTAGFNQSGGLLSRGYLGVDCFFAISGFLITTLLLRERDRTGHVSLRQFYLRRSLRIFPIYFTVLAVYVALMFTQRHTPEGVEFFHNLPGFATYTSNWFSSGGDHATFYFAWSLATEEQFYLFWPPLLVVLKGWWRVGVLIGLIAVDQAAGGLGLRVLASLATPILLGALVALTLHSPRGYAVLGRWLGGPLAAPVVALAVFGGLQAGVPDVVGQVLLVVLVTSVVVREDTQLHPVLTWRPLVFVGVVSYGMYLMQMLAANMVRPILGHQRGVNVFLATVPVVVLVAYVSYRWFETPIRKRASRREVVQT